MYQNGEEQESETQDIAGTGVVLKSTMTAALFFRESPDGLNTDGVQRHLKDLTMVNVNGWRGGREGSYHW